MAAQFFTPKLTTEIVPLAFDFSAVSSAVTSVESLTATVVSGVDASPSSTLLGPAWIQGAVVSQLFANGVSGVTYAVQCLVNSGDERYELTGQIKVT